MRGFTKSKEKHMLKISAVNLIGNPEIPIHYTSLSQVEQAQGRAAFIQGAMFIFLSSVPEATFIQGATFISDSKVLIIKGRSIEQRTV